MFFLIQFKTKGKKHKKSFLGVEGEGKEGESEKGGKNGAAEAGKKFNLARH
jgi:hypothetical protein